MKKLFWAFLLLPLFSTAQSYQQPGAAQIKLKLKKLNFLGSVLYVAAHPDDENTRVITTLANDRLASTAYLSMTRGDGGQNLIGPEISELLGVIRTQELLAARRIDGGQQFFTRAVDFGFSKSADEAFSVWGKDQVLSDVVKVFRQFQPDVIITRFPPDERAGHGHHTASAVLAGEAFDVAAKPESYPDQVKQFGTWQVKRLYTNTGRWWNQTISETTPGVLSMDVGAYNPLLGKSYAEISALSSSQHKSQGWGRRGERGYLPEFFEYMKGVKAEKDFFDGIDTSWKRVKGGEKIQPLIDQALTQFNTENPSALVPLLLQIRKEISALENSVWKTRKLQETDQIIQDCLGLFIEVTSTNYLGSPGEKVKTFMEVVNRSSVNVKLENIVAQGLKWDTTYNAALPNFKNVAIRSSKTELSASLPYSGPYWLNETPETGLFKVTKSEYIGLPENPAAIDVTFNFDINGEKLSIARPLIYKWVDPVKGELWRPYEIVPPVFVNPTEKVIIFNNADPKQISVVIKSTLERPIEGNLKLQLPEGWRSDPASIPFKLAKRDEEQVKIFQVLPSAKESSGKVSVIADAEGQSFNRSLQLIAYDHIPTQTLMPAAEVNIVRMELKKEGNVVGYIKGAGDEVPAALRNMGYEVWEMKDEEVTPANLKKVDAVVLGIRTLNTNKRIRFYMDDLLEYVKEGGTLVMQYNINFDFGKEKLSPYPFKLSRDRVTEENAEVRILKPTHPVLNSPNKITAKDFEGWVQERGLYFANEWDPAFEAIFSMNDKNETPKNGSLLIAQYGKGYYVYTGISFFRQLPDGVTGAYKLFSNLVSLGKGKTTPAVPPARKSK
jgi:LmbE family N-acetylglucosaminyl deacetylase